MGRMGEFDNDLLDALAVTAELTGTELSAAAARVMATDLSVYPLAMVLVALTRCRRELKGRLTLAEIINRLDDGRPGPNEAWAMIPQTEAGSVVWTNEMAEAYGVCAALLNDRQVIAARSAFLESYGAIVARARACLLPFQWIPSLGHDPTQRAGALNEAARLGRLGQDHAQGLLPGVDRALGSNVLFLEDKRSPVPQEVRNRIGSLLAKMTTKP